jgi:hypothetical protein
MSSENNLNNQIYRLFVSVLSSLVIFHLHITYFSTTF